MMIIQDNEWTLTEVGDGRFSFLNVKDGSAILSVKECRYILKQSNYALNLFFDVNIPCLEFTKRTEQRLSPYKRSTELRRVLEAFKLKGVNDADKMRISESHSL